MRSLGLDVGDKRIGVAVSDPEGIIAFSLTVIAHDNEEMALNNVIKLAGQYDVEHIVVGLPLSLNGEIGQQAKKVIAFADKVSLQAKQSNLGHVDIQMWDERLSTVAADRLMNESRGRYKLQLGTKNKDTKCKRINKNSKSSARVTIDAMAAAIILQGFLDSVREKEQCQNI